MINLSAMSTPKETNQTQTRYARVWVPFVVFLIVLSEKTWCFKFSDFGGSFLLLSILWVKSTICNSLVRHTHSFKVLDVKNEKMNHGVANCPHHELDSVISMSFESLYAIKFHFAGRYLEFLIPNNQYPLQ